MESFLDLNEICEEQNSSYALRLVPWLNWDEWVLVKDSLFSNSPDSIAFALKRISAWESRGCLPAAIEATASIIEIKQMDPYCRVDEDQCNDNSHSLSEKMLAHLYCMAIIRLVNGAIEKTRKKEEKSIAVAAEAIGIPRTLIDIRHEASHRGLPSLQLLRSASVKALDWLKSYYWEPQIKAIPFEGDGNAKVRKKIKSKLGELSSCLKSSQSPQSNSPILDGKRSKKQVSKISKSLVQLYSSYSSEIVDVLLEYLLKALSSSELIEHAVHASLGPTINIILADWKVVIRKFWDKEPELLLNLLKEVLITIETQEATKYDEEMQCLGTSRREGFCQVDLLASLFAWVVGILNKVPSAKASVPKSVLLELVRKCLRIPPPSNKQLMDSAFLLAKLIDDCSLMEKVKKLSCVILSNSVITDDESSLPMTSVNFLQMEEEIHQAARKLELFKQRVTESKTSSSSMDRGTDKPRTWTLAKVWNPCPIGMLPRTAGSSGYLPPLDHIDNRKDIHELDRKETQRPNKHGVKRDATLDLTLLDESTFKKKRETGQVSELEHYALSPIKAKGCLLINGLWKSVTEEEFRAIKSSRFAQSSTSYMRKTKSLMNFHSLQHQDRRRSGEKQYEDIKRYILGRKRMKKARRLY